MRSFGGGSSKGGEGGGEGGGSGGEGGEGVLKGERGGVGANEEVAGVDLVGG